jgi:hypothetical protein
MVSKRRFSLAGGGALVAACFVLILSAGCEFDGEEFRAVAGPSLEAGVTTLATGIIDGAFAVYMPDDEDDTASSDSTG